MNKILYSNFLYVTAPAAVENLSEDVQGESIILEWNEVPRCSHNGKNLRYKVEYESISRNPDNGVFPLLNIQIA